MCSNINQSVVKMRYRCVVWHNDSELNMNFRQIRLNNAAWKWYCCLWSYQWASLKKMNKWQNNMLFLGLYWPKNDKFLMKSWRPRNATICKSIGQFLCGQLITYTRWRKGPSKIFSFKCSIPGILINRFYCFLTFCNWRYAQLLWRLLHKIHAVFFGTKVIIM